MHTQAATHAPIIAVNQAVEGVTGTIAFWRLAGAVSVDLLREAADAQHLTHPLPKPPSAKRVLKRALEDLAPRNTLIERHPKGGYAIVHRGETEDHYLDYREGLRAWWGDDGALMVNGAVGRDEILERVEYYQTHYTSEDISLWLPGLVASLQATALRAGGGFYFIPAIHVPTWEAWAELFDSITEHKLYADIPAIPTDGMLEAVLDAIMHEAHATIDRQTRDVTEVGPKALTSRSAQLEQLAAKLTTYEGVLQRKLPDLHAMTAKAQGTVAQAMLTEVDA